MNFDIDLDENKEIKIKKQERQREGIYFTVLLSSFFFNSLPSKHQLQPLNLLITS